MADETTLPEKRPGALIIEEPQHGGFIVKDGTYNYREGYAPPAVIASFSTLQETLDWIGRVYRNVE